MKKHKPMKHVEGERTVRSWIDTGAAIAAIATTVFGGFMYFVTQFTRIDARFEQVDRRFEQIENRLDRVEHKLDHTNTLLNNDHIWRYYFSKDLVLKNRRPVYDPVKQTIEFIVVLSTSAK